MVLNKVFLTGNVAKDVAKHETNSGVHIALFTVAVQRRFKNAQGERETDFFRCQAWRNTADYASQYVHKGDRVSIAGAIQNREYDDKNGEHRLVTEIVVDELEVIRKAEPKQETETAEQTMQRMEEVEDDDDLPF